MTLSHAIALFLSTLAGSASNAIAGGGSFFTVPVLIFTGVAPTIANATSTIALWPGALASTIAYRREVMLVPRRLLLLLTGLSMFGSVIGAYLLLVTSQATFVFLLPYLILFATCLFALSDLITTRSHRQLTEAPAISKKKLLGITGAQFLVAIYCGYFGGGGSIMMVALLALIGLESIHIVNAFKTLLSTCINAIAMLLFIGARLIVWPQALLMISAATIGGYTSAYYARKMDPRWIRCCVIIVGVGLTLYFFLI